MIVRNATFDDLARIEEIYARARKFMAETGNPNQWFDNYPPHETIVEDIELQRNYVAVDENGRVQGVMAFIIGPDYTYEIIDDGEWLNDELYGTIHRIAASGEVKDIFEEMLAFGLTKIKNIRIDTHHDNKVMQHKVLKNGFKYCGIIYTFDKTPRLAYQLIKEL